MTEAFKAACGLICGCRPDCARRVVRLSVAFLVGLLCWGGVPAFTRSARAELPPFELQDGDRVIWIGEEFTEQAIRHNFLEAALTARWPERKLVFRNLGWAGDQPNAIARGYFGGAEEGYRRLFQELTRLRPTVVFLEYGSNSWNMETDEEDVFIPQMKRLIHDIRPLTHRIILVTPPPAEKLPAPLPDPVRINANRHLNSGLLCSLAQSEGLRCVNLIDPLRKRMAEPHHPPYTTDTIRYTPAGYAAVAEVSLRELGLSNSTSKINLEELRELIRVKNELYFHQYRPQNETYLRGFRKHEQGQNAREIEAFEPLIAAAEARISAFVRGEPLPEVPRVTPFAGPSEFTALSPAEQVKQFRMAEGLEIAPFAAEPLITNPIHMNFDGRGRLWVASSPIYPQIRPGAVPEDEIVILEDTDGDGQADKRTVFANDLLIPTAVLPDERGGAYVANSTELLHLADRDGDGRADEKTVILSGFGTEDTHHILHTFRWTPDALLSFNQSIYIHSQLETPYGVQEMLGSGIWRYQPETARASKVAFGMVNPWGYIFDNWGQGFATDGAGGEGINYIFPGAAYVSAVGYPRVMTGMNPGQPKFCGLEILTGGHFGPEYQQSLVTADFRGNRLCRFRLTEEGSGYVSRQQSDLLTCSDRAFRPVDLKLGPDGALYIADWHNPIINHGEVDFRDPRRDHTHGRIWRVRQQGRPLSPRPIIDQQSVTELVELLTHDDIGVRQLARVHLLQRPHQEVAAAIDSWRTGMKPDAPLFDRNRLEALWTCQAIDQIPRSLLQETLSAKDHHVRAAAIRVLSQIVQEGGTLPDGIDPPAVFAAAVQDPHPQVRLEAVNALRELNSSESMPAALKVLDQPMDAWLDYALWVTIRSLEPLWRLEVADGSSAYFENIERLQYMLRAADRPSTLAPLMELLTSDRVPEQQLRETLTLISKFAGEKEARVLFERALERPQEREPLLAALITLAQRRKLIPAGDLSSLQALFPDPRALQLAGLWKLTSLQEQVRVLAIGRETPLPQRTGAIDALTAYQDAELLIRLATKPVEPFTIRQQAVAGLFSFDSSRAAPLAMSLLSGLSADEATGASHFLDGLLAIGEGPGHLEKVIDSQKLPEFVLTLLTQKSAALGARGSSLNRAVARLSGAPAMVAPRSPAELAELLAQVKTHGNPGRGENLFRRSDLTCLNCHSIGGAGGEAGPDLLSLGASSPVDYILDSLLNPSAKIKEGYHTSTFAMEDGKVLSGIVVREGESEVILRNAQNQLITLSKTEIEERAISITSLMPADLVSRLDHNQLLDLVVFLSALGKEGDYKVPQNRFVRRWVTADQREVISRVHGGLNPGDWAGPALNFDLLVTTPGRIALRLAHPDGLVLAWGEKPIPIKDGVALIDLPSGRQRLKLTLPAGRTTPVQVEVVDRDDATGHAEPANRP